MTDRLAWTTSAPYFSLSFSANASAFILLGLALLSVEGVIQPRLSRVPATLERADWSPPIEPSLRESQKRKAMDASRRACPTRQATQPHHSQVSGIAREQVKGCYVRACRVLAGEG